MVQMLLAAMELIILGLIKKKKANLIILRKKTLISLQGNKKHFTDLFLNIPLQVH